jgi:hypothetical protein
MATIPSQPNFPTSKQVPDHAIQDIYGKQAYLGNQFVYNTGTTAISGTSETVLLLITNPSTSKSLFFQSKKLSSLAATSATLRWYLSPTSSAPGTTQTPINMRPANANVSQAVVGLTPTVSANGTYVSQLNSINYYPSQDSSLLILDPGQVLLLTAQVGTGGTNVAVELIWQEI